MTKTDEFQIIWNWDSRKTSVGPISFGIPAEVVVQEHNLIRTPEYEALDQELYEFPDGSSISVENGLINGVDCKSNFFYKTTNLIGLSIEDIRSLLGSEDSLDEFETLISLDFDKYNLVAWLNKDTEKVENIFVYSDDEQ
jgi:hypothetical protein